MLPLRCLKRERCQMFFCTSLKTTTTTKRNVTLLINDFDLLWHLTASDHLDRLINHGILLEKKKM